MPRRMFRAPRLTWLRAVHLLLVIVLLPSLIGLAGEIPGRVGGHRVEAASGIADAVQAIHVAAAASKPAGPFHPYSPGPPFFTTAVSVNYAGGKAVLAAQRDGSGGIYVDDALEVAGPGASRTIDFSQRCTVDLSSGGRQGPLDISTLLQPGTNEVTFGFRDGCGINEGNSDIWLVLDTGPTVPQSGPPPPKVDFGNPAQPPSAQLQPSATPALRLSPAQGPAGTQVQANGMIQPNCGPTFQAFWDAQLTDVVSPSQPQPVQVATGPLNSDGTLDFTFKVPASASPGDHIVGVLAPCTTIPGPYGIPSATFTVTASASPNPGNSPSPSACTTTLKNETGGCLKPNNDGRVLLLVSGIVPGKHIDKDCQVSNSICNATARAKLLAGDAGNDVLKKALSDAGFTPENELPFSYAGPDHPDVYTIDQNHQSIHDPTGKPDSVSALVDYVHRIKHDLGNSTKIVILAHSLGGVITAYAMLTDLKTDDLVERAVIVDSPVGGVSGASTLQKIGATMFANYYDITKSQGVYRDLQTGSSVVNALKPEESDPRLFVVTNWDDQLATVSSALFRDTFASNPRFWVRSLGYTTKTLGHLEAFSSPDAAQAIGGALSEHDPGFPPDDQSDSTLLDAIRMCFKPLNAAAQLSVVPGCAWDLGFGVFSPANILITAPNGLRVGWDPVSQAEVNEIPGAYYSGAGTEPQLIVLPKPVLGSYSVTVTGTGVGTYSLVEQENFGSSLSAVDVGASTTPGEQTRVTANVELTRPAALTFVAAGGSPGSAAPAAIGISLAALAFGAVVFAMARRRRGVAPAAAASPLVLLAPGGARIPLRGGRQVIGRDPGCDIVVQDPQVSRRHALLTVDARGAVVDDLSSSFGVFVNGTRVTRCAVLPGDQLRLGEMQFVLAREDGR